MEVSERFLQNIQKFGKQIRVEITTGEVTRSNYGIISCSKSFNGEMFKTIMQFVEIELVGFVEVGEIVSIRFGVFDDESGQYDLLDWGSFLVDKDTIEKDIGANSTRFTAYDYILKSCVNYIPLGAVYPITLKDYLKAICVRIGLTLCTEDFANMNQLVKEEKFLNGEYTYRDVLDHIAGAVAGAIITKGSNLYVKYPTQTPIVLGQSNQKTMRFMEKWGPVNSLVLSLQPQEDNYYVHDEESIIDNGLTEIKISNNEFLYKERELYAEEIFSKISGFEFFPFEVESFGYGCFEPYDMITIQDQNGILHSCLILNDVVSITGGMNEQINTQMPEIAVTDYSKATSSVKELYRTLLLVDKQNQRIDMVVEKQEDLSKDYAQIQIETDKIKQDVASTSEKLYYIETGRGNIFDNCDHYVRKGETETELKYFSEMPLGIDMHQLRNRDICMSVDIKTISAIPNTLNGRIGCMFAITYVDDTQDLFELWFVPGVYYLAIIRGKRRTEIDDRIYRTFHVKDKEIKYVSNLGIYADVNGKYLSVGRPKVEFGTYPTGFWFDFKAIRDSVTTIEKNYTEIEQKTDSLSLKATYLEREVTSVRDDVNEVDKRLQSAEIKLTPTAIVSAINEKLETDGKIETSSTTLDRDGFHVKGRGFDVTNLSGKKVLDLDSDGNIVVNDITAKNGNFEGIVKNVNGNSTALLSEGCLSFTDNSSNLGGMSLTTGGLDFVGTDKVVDFTLSNENDKTTMSVFKDQSLEFAIETGSSDGDWRVMRIAKSVGLGIMVFGGMYLAVKDGQIFSGSLRAGMYGGLLLESASDIQLYPSGGASAGQPAALAITYNSVTAHKPLYVSELHVTGGNKQKVMSTRHGYVGMEAVESPVPTFEDYGTGVIRSDGEIIIYFDPIWLEVASTEHEYFVFLQACGEGDLCVVERTQYYFKVFGTPNLEFMWNVKARQKGFEIERYKKVEVPQNSSTAMSLHESVMTDVTSKNQARIDDLKEKYDNIIRERIVAL